MNLSSVRRSVSAVRSAAGDVLMKTVEDIRNEVAATTTESLVETMNVLQGLKGRAGIRASGLEERLKAVERSARLLTNLR